jgi:hypothetical protein
VTAPLGATPEAWAYWSAGLGLTDDLLPVVADVTAKVSEKSKLKDVGKTPSTFNRDGYVVGIAAWTRHVSTDGQIARWSHDGRLGICVQTRRVRAFDIDIADPVHSAAVRDAIEMLTGPLPRRCRSNSGKQLLMLIVRGAEGDALTKRICRTPHGAIEFLAHGQQFVAVSTHPSGVRYEWDGLAGLDQVGIPEISLAEFEALWAGIVAAFGDSETTTRRSVAPSVPRSKLDMHGDHVVAFLAENDWVREYDRDGRVHVRCPWEHEHTTDSGPTATSWFPAGVGGFAQGHFKCLHAHCAHRTDQQFMDAIGYSESLFEVVTGGAAAGDSGDLVDEFEVIDEQGTAVAAPAGAAKSAEPDPWPVFVRDRAGRIEATVENTVLALGRADFCGARLAYDEFKDATMIAWGEQWRPLKDTDYTDLRRALERRGFKSAGKELVRDAALKVADANRFDSAIQWARSLRWDGVPRAETFFLDYFGVEDTPYARAVGVYLWTALAGRALEPGCKVDMVPVLISGQGTGKTTMVESLAPEEGAFVEINLEHRDADLARSLRGKLVAELAELRGLATRDAEGIKAWVSRRVEEWTPKYIEFATRYPRRFVSIGTGNNREFLDDDTGERRWLPLEVGHVDVDGIRAVRDQLWAEGVALFDVTGVQWQDAQHLAAEVHAEFKVRDPWHDTIEVWLRTDGMDGDAGVPRGASAVKLTDVAVGALRMDVKQLARKDELRIAKVLRALGYEKRAVRCKEGVSKRWVPLDEAGYARTDEMLPFKMGNGRRYG